MSTSIPTTTATTIISTRTPSSVVTRTAIDTSRWCTLTRTSPTSTTGTVTAREVRGGGPTAAGGPAVE